MFLNLRPINDDFECFIYIHIHIYIHTYNFQVFLDIYLYIHIQKRPEERAEKERKYIVPRDYRVREW